MIEKIFGKHNSSSKRLYFFNNEKKCLEKLNKNYNCICECKRNHFPKIIHNDKKNRKMILSDQGVSLNEIDFFIYSRSDIIMQIDCIVNNLKKNKIIHLDIKPSNICININGVLSLIDFEISNIDNKIIEIKKYRKKFKKKYNYPDKYYELLKKELIEIIDNKMIFQE